MALNAVIAVATGEGGPILLPATADLLWGSVSFVILIIMFTKYVLPRFNTVLQERADKIEGGLARAEVAQAKAEAALKEYTSQLAEARAEAAGIRTQAAEEKRSMIEEAKTEAVTAANAATQRGQEQIRAERSQAVSALQREVGALALDLASRVVGESLQDDARARAVVDAFIADLERQASEAGR
jgi:F-type H+-transporting ATPase subunit b